MYEYTIKTALCYGDEVYRKGDFDPTPGIVVGFVLRPGSGYMVMVNWDRMMGQECYEFELTKEAPRNAFSNDNF